MVICKVVIGIYNTVDKWLFYDTVNMVVISKVVYTTVYKWLLKGVYNTVNMVRL